MLFRVFSWVWNFEALSSRYCLVGFAGIEFSTTQNFISMCVWECNVCYFYLVKNKIWVWFKCKVVCDIRHLVHFICSLTNLLSFRLNREIKGSHYFDYLLNFRVKTKLKMLFGHIAFIVLSTAFNLGIVLCEDVQPIEKSVQLLQLHLCRDECYKKVN